jgi:hypothetical protein
MNYNLVNWLEPPFTYFQAYYAYLRCQRTSQILRQRLVIFQRAKINIKCYRGKKCESKQPNSDLGRQSYPLKSPLNPPPQLADVLELLLDSPDDEELLALKSDLEELIALAEDEAEDVAKDEAEDEALDSSASAPPAGGGGPAPISGPTSSPLQTGLQTEKTYDRNAAAFLTQGSSAVSAPSAPTADDLLNDLDDEPDAPVAEVKVRKKKRQGDERPTTSEPLLKLTSTPLFAPLRNPRAR